jgi:SAM-dependent methyltransferase
MTKDYVPVYIGDESTKGSGKNVPMIGRRFNKSKIIKLRGDRKMSNNTFDNETLFENYKKVRTKGVNYNNLLEQPAMKSLMPDLKDKVILDMGCGFGFSCVEFRKKGAKKVIGIDISDKMLEAARSQSTDENLQFLKLDIEKIDTLGIKFDIVYSSMTMHYLVDLETVIKKVHQVLNDDGIFLFSQDHPISTASFEGTTWIEDDQGVKIAGTISDYLKSGERNVNWMDQSVIKQHRPFGMILNNLIENGFSILKIIEPVPTKETLELAPQMYTEIHRPTGMVIKAKKTS